MQPKQCKNVQWELCKITSCSVTSEAGELQLHSRVMFDKTHRDRRSNNDWQDPLLVLVDKNLVDFLLKDDGVVEHCLRSCPRQVQEVELETFTSKSWSKGEWTD